LSNTQGQSVIVKTTYTLESADNIYFSENKWMFIN